jgi:hypothetical protein
LVHDCLSGEAAKALLDEPQVRQAQPPQDELPKAGFLGFRRELEVAAELVAVKSAPPSAVLPERADESV